MDDFDEHDDDDDFDDGDDDDCEYTADQIEVLHGLEPVRRRPGMYLGATDAGAVHQLLWQVVDSCLDEHGDGPLTRIRIEIDGRRIAVEDNGVGIPVDPRPTHGGATTLELVLTTLHCGRWWRCPALHGLGLSVVTALSERMEVDVWRDGRAHHARFSRGEMVGKVEDRGPTTRTGTRVTFEPDVSILERCAWDRARIAARLRDLAALYPGLTLGLDGEVFRSPDGLSDLVRHLAGDPWGDPVRFTEDHAGEIAVDVALAWTDRPRSIVRGFVGQHEAGGVHVEALRWGLAQAVRGLDDRLVRVNAPALFEVVSMGLVAVVSVEVADPRFRTWPRARLENPEVGAAVQATVAAGLSDLLERDHALRDRLLARIPR